MPVKFKSEVSLDALNNATTDTDKFLVSDSGIVKYRTGTQLLSDLGVSGLYVPYTGATGNVDLGIHTLSSYNLIVNHTSGSGVAASITKGGNGEALTINKSSGSGNAMSVIGGLTSLVDLTLSSIPNATIDTDRFIVSDGGAIKYRTGAEVLSDIGAQAALTNPVTGIGTLNFVSKFTSTGSTLGDSQIFDNGTNVGIGTTSPLQKLHVEGLSYFASDIFTLNNGGIFFSGNNSYQRGIYSNSSGLTLQTLGSPKVTITDSGNVGIGTTSPNETLTLYKSDRPYLQFVSATTGTDVTDGTALGFTTAAGEFQIRNKEAQAVTISTSDTERMRITSSGNVGIGTSSPTAKLTLADVVETKFDITDTGGHSKRFFVRNSDKTLAIYNNDAGQQRAQLRLVTGAAASSDRLSLLEAGGNVGIGTTSPASILNVVQNVNSNSSFIIRNTNAGSSAYTNVVVRNDANQGVELGVQSTTRSATYPVNEGWLYASNSLNLGYVGNTKIYAGSTEKMRITSTGNVGIGTTAPNTKLTIEGTLSTKPSGVNAYYSYLRSNWSADNAFELGISDDGVSNFHKLITSSNYYNGSTLQFWTNDSERARFDISGNFGIGTTSPSAKLNVYGDLHLGAYSNLSTVNFENRTNKATFSISTNGVTNAAGTTITYSWADGGHGPLKFNNSSSEVMRLSANGNIGIGTTNTIHQLSVASKIGGATFGDSFIEFPSSGNTIVKANNDVILGYSQSTSIKQSGNVGIGTASPNASAILHLRSTTQGFLPPVMRTGERNGISSPAIGLMIFNEDDDAVQVYTGEGWRTLAWA